MDFSSTHAALRSLKRRPTTSDALKSLAEKLEGPFAGELLWDGKGLGDDTQDVEQDVLELLGTEEWEGVSVGFLLAKSLVDNKGQALSPSFLRSLLAHCDQHLEHAEPRVRSLVASTLGALTRADDESSSGCTGLAAYEFFRKRLSGAISKNFERTTETITDVISGAENVAVDDTSGWKALETSFLALKEFVDAVGRPFIDGGHLNDETVGYIVSGATVHINRHVREASYQIIRSILDACGTLSGSDAPQQGDKLAHTFAEACAVGMQDNWSQVRYAASVANRSLLKALSPADREQFYPRLLPRMCLNRYYLADGVKLFSQETWRMFMGEEGREMVGKYAQDVTDYYCMASELDNHCVRESACHSIAEMAEKVAPQYLATHVDRLLKALLVCFFDESWPVRDAACVASGRFAGAYPEECRPSLEKLYERWFRHVGDPIWSVRDDSATALGAVCKAYGEEAYDKVSAWVKENLPRAKQQGAESAEQHRRKHNDAKAHTGNQVFSCGSLAPKLRKGGCSDCQVTRPSEPWEFSDGAVYLVRELCFANPEVGVTFFEELADVARLTHFVQADCLRETIWKQLPAMGEAVGKNVFKRHLDVFLKPLFDTLSRITTSQLARHAAASCVRQLSKFIGPSIFRGRLTDSQREIMDAEVQLGGPPGPSAGLMGMTKAPWATMAS
ncbi:unnamed protein product [Ectocarpus sp. 6 AP-2014]